MQSFKLVDSQIFDDEIEKKKKNQFFWKSMILNEYFILFQKKCININPISQRFH